MRPSGHGVSDGGGGASCCRGCRRPDGCRGHHRPRRPGRHPRSNRSCRLLRRPAASRQPSPGHRQWRLRYGCPCAHRQRCRLRRQRRHRWLRRSCRRAVDQQRCPGHPQATANGGSTVTGESALAQQQAEGKGRQSQTHDTNLKGIIRISCRATSGRSGLKGRFSGSSGHRGIADRHRRRGHGGGGGDGHGRGHASRRHHGSDGYGNLRSAEQQQPEKGLQDA